MTFLALTGRTKWYTFCQEEPMDDQALIYAMTDLYKRGWVRSERGRLALSEPMRKLFEGIGESEYVIELEFAEGEASCHLVYPIGKGRGIILEKESVSRWATVKLWEDDIAYYVYDLMEKGLLSEGLLKEREEAEAVEEMAWKEYAPEEEGQECLLRVRRVRAEEGETDNTVEVFRTSIFQWIHIYGGNGEYYHVYSEEDICELLIRELKGAEL